MAPKREDRRPQIGLQAPPAAEAGHRRRWPGRLTGALPLLLLALVVVLVAPWPAAAFVPPAGLTAVPLTTRPGQLKKASKQLIDIWNELVRVCGGISLG
jgi:hypothetical protein